LLSTVFGCQQRSNIESSIIFCENANLAQAEAKVRQHVTDLEEKFREKEESVSRARKKLEENIFAVK